MIVKYLSQLLTQQRVVLLQILLDGNEYSTRFSYEKTYNKKQ